MSTRRTSGSSSRRRPRSRTATRSRSFPPSPGAVEPVLTMPRIRVRLTFPPEQIQQPIVYHLVKDFDLIPNIRRAEVKADYGWMALELEGDEGALERAVAWLKGRGVRVQGFTESVIREMTRVVAQVGGVNLAQGMPNFPPPPELIEAAHAAIDGDFHQYAITWGTPRLRRAIADKYAKFYGMDVDPERNVTVCCGSTETMLSTLLAVLNPGDEVIVFEPFYENYGPGCIISGAKPVFVPLEPPDFGFDPDRLARAVSTRTRAIVFNSPNNPTGKVFSRAELETIATLCREHDLLAITDEIYEHIVYDGLGHTPIATLPGMAERTVTISGISKSYSVTGWRIGYAIAAAELSDGIRRAHDFVTVGAPHPLQEAAVVALGLPGAYYARLRAE